MMELKDFISATLEAIAISTTESQAKLLAHGVVLNPPSSGSEKDYFEPGSPAHTKRRVHDIQFDVAVTVASAASGGGSGGIKVWAAELGAKAEKNTSNERVSRVQFSVPMSFKPSGDEKANAATKQQRSDRLPNVVSRAPKR